MTQPATQIAVDLAQLRAASQVLAADTSDDLKPGLSDTDLKIQQGVAFGARSASSELSAARQAFGLTLLRHADNFGNHVRQAEQLVAFLAQVLQTYQDADELSAAEVKAIVDMLDDALPPEPKPSPTHGNIA